MSKFIIKGQNKLKGEIEVSGMKNAATPILAAIILTKEKVTLHNIPIIDDVKKMLDIMESIGVKIEWLNKDSAVFDASNINAKNLDQKSMKSMRSSILFMGSFLSRFGEVEIPEPGGCLIGNRPMDYHFYAFEKLGAVIEDIDNHKYALKAKKLVGNYIIMPGFSVTGTENVIMASVLAEGKTIIKLAACEPHVQDLCLFLNKMGAKINFGRDSHTIEIEGVKELMGCEHTIIPDQIEAGTYAILATATKSDIIIKNIIPEHLDIVLLELEQVGADIQILEGDGLNNLKNIHIKPGGQLKAVREITTYPYPGFPTDLQAVFGVLATQCTGTTIIHDTIYEGRMGYINELFKMGANVIIADPHRAIITGPTPLYGTEVKTLDLRAGATLIIAALIAEGQSTINDVEIIDRGYERIEEKLRNIGANIIRE
ncbi:MAG TPA: UDP-N-acetylglucosamine 1-carboxyvinyltransferase [bacterium]|mgnify:FL=1|nr:UDP-N-acetylglucosamine 1-carboxyvinyltransferase [bacterium]